MKRALEQTGLLALVSIIFVSPQLLRDGTNIVTNTYALASLRFWHGLTPYVPLGGISDAFKYSPFFALLYGPISLLGSRPQALLWALLNCSVFWYGVSRWFSVEKKWPAWLWIALVLCSMELDGSLHYQQVNALLIGMILLGLADYRDGRFFRSGLILWCATDLKVFPGILAAPLLIPWRRDYVKGALAAVIVSIGAPMLIWGIRAAVAPCAELQNGVVLHSQWLGVLAKDVGHPEGFVNLHTMLTFFGASASFVRLAHSLLVTLSLLVVFFSRLKRGSFPWAFWIPFTTALILLASPRTESPTFVLIAPSYLFLTAAALEGKTLLDRRLLLTVLLVAMFLVTLSYNDVWPKRLFNPGTTHFLTKSMGVFLLWLVSGGYLARSFLLVDRSRWGQARERVGDLTVE